jgi:nitric oxide reductase subunit C
MVAVSLVVVMARTASAGADEGKAVYEAKCKACHSIAGEGGKMADKGGPLDGVGAKRDAAWLRGYLKDPKSQIPDAKMPKLPLTDQQLKDLVAYLLTLKTAAPAK